MSALIFALALMMADEAPTATAGGGGAAEAAAPAGPAWPTGAPRDDYGLVAWCYGALSGYLDLHDQVMPEVTRIESAFRRPGSSLADDLKVYADMRKDGQRQMKLFAEAIEAAEKASIRPINAVGAAAIKRGRGVWAAAPNLSKARLAQEWMSWALPARCESTAVELAGRAKILGAAFRVEGDAADSAPDADPLGDVLETAGETLAE